MTLIAASGLGAVVLILFALACPLMMIFMMRGHGGHGGGHGHGEHSQKSLDELKAERDELNEEIVRAEQTVAR